MSNTTLDVLIERVDNGFKGVHRRFDENVKEHEILDANQKTTNGKVRRLEVWKGTLAGIMAVVVFISGYALNDYFKFKDTSIKIQEFNAVITEQLRHHDQETEELKARMSFIESLIEKQ